MTSAANLPTSTAISLRVAMLTRPDLCPQTSDCGVITGLILRLGLHAGFRRRSCQVNLFLCSFMFLTLYLQCEATPICEPFSHRGVERLFNGKKHANWKRVRLFTPPFSDLPWGIVANLLHSFASNNLVRLLDKAKEVFWCTSFVFRLLRFESLK